MCDRRFQVSYLIKYATKVETHSDVRLRGKEEMDKVDVLADGVKNIHLATEKHVEKQLDAKKVKGPKKLAREISYTEVLWNNLSFPYVMCNVEFISAPSLPLEARPGVLKQRIGRSCDHDPQSGRENFPAWRQFTPSQVLLISEYKSSSVRSDETSLFMVRPPELFAFDSLTLYLKCFKGCRRRGSITADLSSCPWIGGTGLHYKLRTSHLQDAIEFLERQSYDGNCHAGELLHAIFYPLQDGNEDLQELFLDNTSTDKVIIVNSLVKPSSQIQFVYHLCLTLGRVKTDLDFMHERCMSNSELLFKSFVIHKFSFCFQFY